MFLIRLNTRSLKVNINKKGVIELPEGTVLENGTWAILDSSGENQLGVFEVREGKVGTAYSTLREPPILAISFLGMAMEPLTLQELAAMDLANLEVTISILEQRPCPNCDQVHSLREETRTKLRETTLRILNHPSLPQFIADLEKLVTENDSVSLDEAGYESIEEARAHLTQYQEFARWAQAQTAAAAEATPSSATPTQTAAPA